MKKEFNVSKAIFLISLLYYVGLLGYAVYCSHAGVDSGWAMPAMSDGSKDYGIEAFCSGIAIGIIFTAERFLFIPIYQAIYLIVCGIGKLINRKNK
ncbi:hypothetical protein SAMN02910447_01340 [Ruminococcus sp. YE71]|uniref:hypothetical protein n=1 Tax=unclassified Ruminococcus TaxID=2608920 RepID=UPI000888FA2E|nr:MULTISPECIES: hypothetical protein [unclassified Ruminococcus]SDA17585.1 hypothetical protein SAMN02910446_01339 [Ruminococcus sp. YE78]SFW27047.1 hypothetical protein SAMN02910447_01340 [Ruminococcus sp. YE71]